MDDCLFIPVLERFLIRMRRVKKIGETMDIRSVRFFDWQHYLLRKRFNVRACDFARFLDKAYRSWWRWAFYIFVFTLIVLFPVKKEEHGIVKIFLNPLLFIDMRIVEGEAMGVWEVCELNSSGLLMSSQPLSFPTSYVFYKVLCFCRYVK